VLPAVVVEQDVMVVALTLRSCTEQAEHEAPALAEPALKYWPAGQVVAIFIEQDLKSDAA
jgi:hypothetical protein